MTNAIKQTSYGKQKWVSSKMVVAEVNDVWEKVATNNNAIKGLYEYI